jgi:hypothetical protein
MIFFGESELCRFVSEFASFEFLHTTAHRLRGYSRQEYRWIYLPPETAVTGNMEIRNLVQP